MAYMGAHFSISNLDANAVRQFDAWCAQMGFRHNGRKAGFYYLVRAIVDHRLLVLDKGTRDILVGAARAEVLLEARLAARQESKIVLWEEGFIPDPGGVEVKDLTKL